jgi:hypothetical protein
LSSRRLLGSGIGDPALAALLSTQRAPLVRSSFTVPPPPPPVIIVEHPPAVLNAPRARLRSDSVPDSAVTQPLPTRVWSSAEPEVPAASFTPVVLHARPLELSLVAALSVAATLALTWFAQAAAHWGDARAPISELRSASTREVQRLPVPAPSLAQPPVLAAAIPTVRIVDLPVERRGALQNLGGPGSASASFASSPGGVNRAQLVHALSRAAQSAQSCGPGPVHAQVVATFGPSGVARGIHFGAAAPPRPLRSCVLNAVARIRVPAFVGEPVTVSKTLAW